MKDVNKKAVSAVVATVLIILIVVAAISFIWIAITPMINQDISSEKSIRLSIVTSDGYTVYDEKNEILCLQISRGNDNQNLKGAKILISEKGNSFSKIIDAPNPNQKITKCFNLMGIKEMEKISVAPIFDNGKEGKISSSTKPLKSSNELNPKKLEWVKDLNGLVSYWEFEGNLKDSIGNLEGLSRKGTEKYVSGKNFEKALKLHGENNLINFGNSKEFDMSTEVSCLIWIYSGKNTGQPKIIGKQNVVHKPTGGLTSPWHVYSIGFKKSYSNNSEIRFDVGNKTKDIYLSSSTKLIDEKWYHIAGVFDNGNVSIYVNGELENTQLTGFSTLNSNFEPILLGSWDTAGIIGDYNGTLDKAMIFNKALNAEEIKKIYNLQK